MVVPVKDGERYLQELLEGLARERPDEVLVIDSGSRDRSLEIVRSAGVELLQIEPYDFSHGRTRNLGAERTSGELICFLTQDATPCPGWLAAYWEAFTLELHVGAAYGPHLPRPDTPPMIARELTQFFAGFSPDGQPVVQHLGDPTFLANVNACYARACWEEIRFRDVRYSEDQAFGADMLAAGWSKVYHPGAAVLHAHDYGPLEFMKRYFDEYRGLRSSIGHIETFGLRSGARDVRALVTHDRRWMSERDYTTRQRLRWTSSAAHHSGRKVFSTLGSRSDALPAPVRRRLSFEGSDHAPEPPETSALNGSGGAHGPGEGHSSGGSDSANRSPGAGAGGVPTLACSPQAPRIAAHEYEPIARILSDGPAPLSEATPAWPTGRGCT